MVVPIDRIIYSKPYPNLSNWFVKKTAAVLTKQGQIEPLQVTEVNGMYRVHGEEPYGDEILKAAHLLGWPTLLIVVTERYIR